MNPVDHPNCNFTFTGPTDEIGDLRCEIVATDRDDDAEGAAYVSHVVSYWQPTVDELAELNAGGYVRLGVWALPIPPLSVMVEPADETAAAPAITAPAPVTTLDLVVKGHEIHAEPSTMPVDATDLLNLALDLAGVSRYGDWELRDADGVRFEPNDVIAERPQPFYIDPTPGWDG